MHCPDRGRHAQRIGVADHLILVSGLERASHSLPRPDAFSALAIVSCDRSKPSRCASAS
jgi:hypothetical protein